MKECEFVKDECINPSVLCEDCFVMQSFLENTLNEFADECDDDLFSEDCDYYEDKYGNLIAVIDYDIDDLPF